MSKQGYSLTELLVVMGMTSVVLTVGLGLVHRVVHETKSVDRENAMHRVAERLSTKLRADVHFANRAELIEADGDGQQRLVLRQPGETAVTYTVNRNVLDWTSIQEGEPTHRDSFRFPDNYRLQFVDLSAGRVTFTAFALPTPFLEVANENSPVREVESSVRRAVMRVEATVGRDHRFSSETRKPNQP